jgi:hypothetical protein
VRPPRHVAYALAVLAALVGCSHDDIGPTAGTLNLTLASPNSDDGAVLFTISGGPVDSLTAPGQQIYTSRLDSNTLRVILIGPLQAGTVARVYLPDVRLASNYSAAVNQAAARSSYAQRNPAAYSVNLLP